MIHYHGTPMTPRDQMIHSFAKRHAMVSYSDARDVEVVAEICHSFCLDNGAFRAWKQGLQYDFNDYAEWAQKWIKHPACDWCVIPDVIDGSEADNDGLLKHWPISLHLSVPVYHLHESLHRLDQLIRHYPRVALGSSGRWADPGSRDWWARMAEVIQIACDDDGMPRVKLHGLRMLDPVIFSQLPLASADSCNVARNAGYDVAWNGPYAPPDRASRALILMNRIEAHASANRWCQSSGVQQNMELIG